MSFQPIEADDKDILVFHDILGQDAATSQAQLPVATLPVTNNYLNASAPTGQRPSQAQRSASPSENSPLKPEQGQIGPKRPSVEVCGFGIGAVILFTSSLTLALSLTIGLILSIRFGPPQIPPSGAVISPSSECSAIGLDILKLKMGSAADAAIAMALCAGVVRAESSGLGGDGFAIYHDHRRSEQAVYDGRSCSPSKIDRLLQALEKDANSNTSNSSTKNFSPYRLTGWAVTTPTELALFWQLHQRRGKLPWKELFAPVIDLARTGFRLTSETVTILNSLNLNELAEKLPRLADLYLSRSGDTWTVKPAGTLIQRPDLADLLQRISSSQYKFRYFYESDPSLNIFLAINGRSPDSKGLFLTANFSSQCTWSITEKPPLSSLFKDYTIMYPGLPSSGIAVAEILGILSETNFTKLHVTKDSADFHKVLAEATKYAFTDLYYSSSSNDSIEYLTNSTHWSLISSQIDMFNVPKSWSDYALRNERQAPPVPLPKAETTGNFVSALDEHEGFVALTLSLGSPFGSMIATADGIVLNNHMEAFYYDQKVVLHPNAIGPNKKPWSVQSPIVAHVPQSCKIRTAVGVIPYMQAQIQIQHNQSSAIPSAWYSVPSAAEVLARLLAAGRDSASRSLSRWRYSPLPLTGDPALLVVEGNFTNLTNFEGPGGSSIEGMKARGYSLSIAESPLTIAGIVSKVSDHIDDRADPRAPSFAALHF